jgi:hypothetical protein
MHRLVVFIALLLLLPLVAAADEGAMQEDGVLVLNGASVVGSPGVPQGLESFLPGGKAPGKLGWPLPRGSLVVVGLPHQDPAARRICDVFQLDVDDLGGGYALWAWRDGRHARVFLMGADPAALQAARFEFDADAPMEMMAPDVRSLDFKRPNEEAYCVVRAGTRRVRPHHRMRAWAPGDFVRAMDAMTAGGERASHIWIETTRDPHRGWVKTVAALRAQGVTPVVALRVPGPLTAEEAEAHAGAGALQLQAWQRQLDVQHVALVFEQTTAAHERMIASRIAAALRAGGLEQLVVVPTSYSDRLARVVGPAPDLRAIPEAVIAWSGPLEHSTRIRKQDAERRVREAGVPVVLLETWAAADQTGNDAARILTLPRGRDAALPDALEGIVVVGRTLAGPILDAAWAPAADHRFGPGMLAPLVPVQRTADPEAFAADLMQRLRAADQENLGQVPWMAPLADALRDAIWRRGGKPSAAAVPVVPQRVAVDGRIDEPAWAFARTLVRDMDGVDVFVLSDGEALRFALRIRKDTVGETPFLLQLSLEAPGRTVRWHVRVSPQGVEVDRSGRDGAPKLEPGHVRAARRESSTHYGVEVDFDRFALGGEPHAGRLFLCGLSWGPVNLWPAGPSNGVTGTLLVTR